MKRTQRGSAGYFQTSYGDENPTRSVGLNLARRFNAGIASRNSTSSRQRRMNPFSTVATRRTIVFANVPGLERPG
ncbi:MAG: hypothetical protein WAQ99_14860 [Pyrinomonadaceae bacterium]